MKFLYLVALTAFPALAAPKSFHSFAQPILKETQGCFLRQVEGQKIERVGKECQVRYPACSTFKIALSLMAFDSDLLQDENTHFKWDGVQRELPAWNQDQLASDWMRNSTVWVSQRLTPLLGEAKIKKYLKDFHYGTEDLSGGIAEAWLTQTPGKDTLRISPEEQLHLMSRLFKGDLPVSKKGLEKTKLLLLSEPTKSGGQVWGKTGTGSLADGRKIGWYVYHYEQKGKSLNGVTLLVRAGTKDVPTGKMAKTVTYANLE